MSGASAPIVDAILGLNNEIFIPAAAAVALLRWGPFNLHLGAAQSRCSPNRLAR